jgi:glutamine cyclotransferase
LGGQSKESNLNVRRFCGQRLRRELVMRIGWIFAAGLMTASMLGGTARAQESGPYKVIRIQLTGGEGGWDYITADPDSRHLFVARSGPTGHIGIYNLDTLEQIGDIPNVSAHGGAVDTETGHGFATSNPVTMFDAKTFAVIKKIDTGGHPDGYLNDTYNHHFYILSHTTPNITVLDDKDGSILGTIDIGGAPEQAAADRHGKIYVDIEDKAAIAVIDANTMKMVDKYDLSPQGAGCAGLALDAQNGILFAACREKNNMVILSAANGHIITDLPIGEGCDGVTFNPATMEAASSQGDGTMTIIKEDSPTSFRVEQIVATPMRARTHTLDTKTGNLYTITGEFGSVPKTPPANVPANAPAWMRRPRPPMIPHSFQILVIGMGE